MIEPYPDATVWRPFRFHGDGAERQGRGEGCEGLRSYRDLDHAGDIGSARASRQIAPAPGEVSNAGATHFSGRDQRHAVATRRPGPVNSLASPMPRPVEQIKNQTLGRN